MVWILKNKNSDCPLFKTGWEDSPPLLYSWIKWWWSRELASLINIGFKNENLATSSRHLLYFPGGLIIIDHNQLCGGMDGTHCGSITKWIPISPKPTYLSQQQSSKFGYIWFDLSWCGTHDTQRDFADHKISVIFRRLNLAPKFSKQQLRHFTTYFCKLTWNRSSLWF